MVEITEEQKMPAAHRRLLDILRKHPGKAKAISMAALYEEYSGETIPRDEEGRPQVDVPTLTREMRRMIDDLRDIHRVPVMSSSAYGYWIVVDQKELEMVRQEFLSRGIKSLQTAARLQQISLVDAVQQLALELQDGKSTIRQHLHGRSRPTQPDLDAGELILSPEAKMAVITKHLQELLARPEDYIDQIRALQRQFGPKLLPRNVLDAINAQATHVRELANKTIEAANRLQKMVGG